MGTNLKGQSGIKGLALLHGEKVAIGIVALVSLFIIYKSFSLPRLEDKYQADKLQSAITQTSSEIKQYSWDKAVADHPDKIKKFQEIHVSGDLGVKPEAYVNLDKSGKPDPKFDEPIVAPLILRSDPVLLNATDVRATGGSGLLSFLDEEIRKKQEIKRQMEEQELAKKAAEKAKRDEKKKATETAGPSRRGKETAGPEEPYDPAHPKRRLVQNGGRLTGAPLQGGERIERAYWACVVAKVPIRDQLKLYQDAFEKARGSDPNKDFPSYVGFFVERAEVLPGKDLEWTPVPLYDGQQQSIAQGKSLTTGPAHVIAVGAAYDKLIAAAQAYWSGGISQDVIDPRFAEAPLTLPLPPLVGREWGAEATHPDIPLAIDTPPLEDQNQPQPTQPTEQKPGDTSEFGSPGSSAGGPPMISGPGMGGPGRPMAEFSPRPNFSYGRGPGSVGPPGFGPGSGPRMIPPGQRVTSEGPGVGGNFRGGGAAAGQHDFLPKGVDYYLLRFFDFTVEPGKKYKYRVKLVVQDPNYNFPSAVLAPSVQDRQAKEAQAAKAKNLAKPFYRILDKWSDPSPTVGIPMAGNVHLAETKIPRADSVNDEPSAKLLVEAFDVDAAGSPIQGGAEKDLRRGYVANAVQDVEYLVEGGTAIDTLKDFKMFTGMTLLDIDGGQKLARDINAPSRILLMGPAGQLYIRNDTDDKPVVENHRTIFAKPDKHATGPEGPGGPPGSNRPKGGPRR